MVANKSKRVPGSKEEGKALRRRRIIGENILGTCMAAPPFLAFVFFSVIPMAVSLAVSFMDLHSVVVSTARPVGLENYKKLLQDPTTYTSLVNTAKYCIHVVFNLVMAVFLANMLANKKVLGKAAIRVVYFIPAVIPGVAATVMWSWIFNENFGMINQALTALGLGTFHPYTNPSHFMIAVWILRLWIGGTNIVLLQSAFASVNKSLQEAARVDGATERQVFWKITLPQVSPTIFYLLVTNFVAAAQEMATLQVFANNTVGPGENALVVAYYLQRMIGAELQTKGYGMSCAMSWMYSILLIIITRIGFKISDKVVSYD